MAVLLLDIGNTQLKWGVDSEAGFRFGGVCDSTLSLIKPLFTRHWAPLKPDHLMLSCVGNKAIEQQIVETAQSAWGIQVESLTSPQQGCGLTNAYAQPATLGSDRWAAMVAAYRQVDGPVCVVSSGTAVTLDAVSGKGQHLGGLILPGFGLMPRCLQSGTQLDFDADPAATGPVGLGRSTEQCIQHGTATAISTMVDTVFAGLLQEQPGIALVLTGGDANLLQERLGNEASVEPYLVLQGLAIIHRSAGGSA